MSGQRIDRVCDYFKNANEFPKELADRVNILCSSAELDGDGDVLTEEEASVADYQSECLYSSSEKFMSEQNYGWAPMSVEPTSVKNMFDSWNGAFGFAKAIADSPRDYENSNHIAFGQKLYNGFKSTSLNEPPFFINGNVIRKIEETKNSQTIVMNNFLYITIRENNNEFTYEFKAPPSEQELELVDERKYLSDLVSFDKKNVVLKMNKNGEIMAKIKLPELNVRLRAAVDFENLISIDEVNATFETDKNGRVTTKVKLPELRIKATAENFHIISRKIAKLYDMNHRPLNILGRLPFLEDYKPESGRKWCNSSSASNHPLTMTKHEVGGWAEDRHSWDKYYERLYMDGFNRFFTEKISSEKVERRTYLKSPKMTLDIMDRLNMNENKFSWHGVRFPIGCGCFAGAMMVRTDSGLVSFENLYEQYMQGESLPKVKVYDFEKKKMVEQEPKEITRQYVYDDVALVLMEDKGVLKNKPLEVTPNHFITVKRNNNEYWMRANELRKGDLIRNAQAKSEEWLLVDNRLIYDLHRHSEDLHKSKYPNLEPSFSLEENADIPSVGATAVYNISFGSPEMTDISRNYYVCIDEDTCFNVHNKMYQLPLIITFSFSVSIRYRSPFY